MVTDIIRTFRITEPDLQKLEAAVPEICDLIGVANNNPRVQVLLSECKEILSNVRWSYGPPQSVEVVR